jgi:copper chaperone CopZ
MNQVTLRIDGMHCGACVRRVNQALQAVPGVKAEEIRVGAARLEVDEPAHAQAAIDAIAKAGYTAYKEQ